MTTLFCSECNNMLYPKEDRAEHRLLYACRNCDFQQESLQPKVYHRQIMATAMDQTLATLDLSHDPTYPRSKLSCSQCGHPESVFFQSKSKAKDATMKLFFACCNTACGHRWTQDEQV